MFLNRNQDRRVLEIMKFGKVVSCKNSKSVLIIFLFLEFLIFFFGLFVQKRRFLANFYLKETKKWQKSEILKK